MCIKILEAQNKIVSREYGFLLKGGIVLDRGNQADKPVTWLPDECWDNITELDKLAGFHGIIASFEQNPRNWHNWYRNSYFDASFTGCTIHFILDFSGTLTPNLNQCP